MSVARSMHSLIPVFVKQKANKMERVQVYLSVRKSYFVLDIQFFSVAFAQSSSENSQNIKTSN